MILGQLCIPTEEIILIAIIVGGLSLWQALKIRKLNRELKFKTQDYENLRFAYREGKEDKIRISP